MTTDTISSRNLKSLLILMVLCGSLVNGAFSVAQDTWISVLLMGVIFLPVILLYARICTLLPGENLYARITCLFGRIGSIFVILPMSLYALVVAALQLRNFTEFTVVIALQNTPPLPIMIALILPALYLAQKGPQVLGRWSLIVCVIIIVNIFLTIFSALDVMDFTNVLPIMDHSFTEIAADAFFVGCIALGETVMTMTILGHRRPEKAAYGIYLPGILLGVFLFALIILRNIFILGAEMEQVAKFSTYMAVRIIRVGSFFERIESSISFVYVLMGITKITLYLSAAATGAACMLKVRDYKSLLLPAGVLVILCSTVVFNNVFEMYDLVRIYWYAALPLQVVIPLIIWIVAEIKAKKHGAKGPACTKA